MWAILIATPRRLVGLASLIVGGSTLAYHCSEHVSIATSAWWATITLTTVGYGDQYPHHAVGKAAGAVLAITMVFVVIPCLTARIVAKHIHSADFTETDKREILNVLRQLRDRP